MVFIRRITLLAMIFVLVTTQGYSILASGFDCEIEEQFMLEDPSYARIMLNGMHGNKERVRTTFFMSDLKPATIRKTSGVTQWRRTLKQITRRSHGPRRSILFDFEF